MESGSLCDPHMPIGHARVCFFFFCSYAPFLSMHTRLPFKPHPLLTARRALYTVFSFGFWTDV